MLVPKRSSASSAASSARWMSRSRLAASDRRRDRTVSDSARASSVVSSFLVSVMVSCEVVEEGPGTVSERPRVRLMKALERPVKPRWASLPRSVSSLEASW